MEMASWMDGAKPTRCTGIFKTKKGYRVRVRAADPRTGTQKEANREFEGVTLEEAITLQQSLRQELRREGSGAAQERVKYVDYAERLLERKVATNELTSGKSRRTWADAQDLHLVPAFGEWFVDAIRRSDLEDWKQEQGKLVAKGELSPNTVNGRLRVLLATLRAYVVEHDAAYDPTRGVKPLDTSTWQTYTEEEPNALAVDEVAPFMAKVRELLPQDYAMIALGLGTGRRPCELRPLRRTGATPDVLWNEGVLLVRRSQTMGTPLEKTKTGVRLRIPLPAELMDILRWHQDRLPAGPMRDSELLFPSTAGTFRSTTCLDKPIREAAKAVGITKHLTAYCMRRTFQDLGRAACVHDFVVRAISGHATSEMQSHYSTVAGEEVRAGLAKVISLAGFLRSGDRSGESAPGEASGSETAGRRMVSNRP